MFNKIAAKEDRKIIIYMTQIINFTSTLGSYAVTSLVDISTFPENVSQFARSADIEWKKRFVGVSRLFSAPSTHETCISEGYNVLSYPKNCT